jgi:hypothetical protein
MKCLQNREDIGILLYKLEGGGGASRKRLNVNLYLLSTTDASQVYDPDDAEQAGAVIGCLYVRNVGACYCCRFNYLAYNKEAGNKRRCGCKTKRADK